MYSNISVYSKIISEYIIEIFFVMLDFQSILFSEPFQKNVYETGEMLSKKNDGLE
jgi:hypothetical protein